MAALFLSDAGRTEGTAAAWAERWALDDAAEVLYRMARRVVARSMRPVFDRMVDGEDLVQEAVARAALAVRRLPPTLEEAQARGWLYRVMRLAVWDTLSHAHRSTQTALRPVAVESLEDSDDRLLVAAVRVEEEIVDRLLAAQHVRLILPLLTALERDALARRMRDVGAGQPRTLPKSLENALARVRRKAQRALLVGSMPEGRRGATETLVLAAMTKISEARAGGPGARPAAVAWMCGYGAGNGRRVGDCLKRLADDGRVERCGWSRNGRRTLYRLRAGGEGRA